MHRVMTTGGESHRSHANAPGTGRSSRLRRSNRADDFAVRSAMHDEIHRELYRSRRYSRSFAVIRISPASGHGGSPPALASFLRLIDRAWTTDRETWVLLPEASMGEAQGFVDRLRADAPRLVAGRSVGSASFPETALTLEGLLAATRARPDDPASADGVDTPINVTVRHDDTIRRTSAM